MTFNAHTLFLSLAVISFAIAAIPLPKDWKGAWDFTALGFGLVTLAFLV